MSKDERIFTLDEGWLYQFISWIHIEKGFVLVNRKTGDIPTFDDMIDSIKEFVTKKKGIESEEDEEPSSFAPEMWKELDELVEDEEP
jgi:hypothetical protein